MKEKLMKILSVPIYPHELADPTEAVADYLLDNDVVPVVRCKDCKFCKTFYPAKEIDKEPIQVWFCKAFRFTCKQDDFCSYGERREDNGKSTSIE